MDVIGKKRLKGHIKYTSWMEDRCKMLTMCVYVFFFIMKKMQCKLYTFQVKFDLKFGDDGIYAMYFFLHKTVECLIDHSACGFEREREKRRKVVEKNRERDRQKCQRVSQ